MTTSPSDHRAGRITVAFAVLGGAVAWLAHLVAASVIAEWGYFAGLEQSTWLGLTLIAWLIIVLSIAMTLLAAAATAAAVRLRRQTRDPAAANQSGTRAFLARLAVVTSSIFLFIIVAESIPILFFLHNS